MTVRATSLAVFYNEIKPQLSQKQAEIYRYFLDGGCYTNKDIKAKSGLEINQITPRTGELVGLGFLFEWKEKRGRGEELVRSIHPQGRLF